MYKIKAIIFDCDGTLVNSEESHVNAWRKVVEDLGFYLSHDDYSSFVGNPNLEIAKIIESKIKSYPAHHLLERKKKHFFENLKKGLPPIAGTTTFLKHLIKNKDRSGIKLAVASAAPKDEIWLNLKHLKVDKDFEIVLSGEEDLDEYHDPAGVNKPQPYVYLHAAKLLGVSPSECVVIEDSMIGVAAGVKAGCFTIAVPTEHSKNHDLSKAHLILESLAHFTLEKFLTVVSQSIHH